MTPEFKQFSKIKRYVTPWMRVTQKIHGTNGQIYITEDNQVFAGSRTRWLTSKHDNYGFCKWVIENQEMLICLLGPGRHYGEWAGPGINSGEGLKEKTFILFCLPHGHIIEGQNLKTVPELYYGIFEESRLFDVIEDLKTHGSYLVDGFMRPEGVVIEINSQRFKHVFDPEVSHWTQPDKPKTEQPNVDVSGLLDSIRMQKLLSKDEQLIRDFPITLSEICKLYIEDLESENVIKVNNDDEYKVIMKALGRQIYQFAKQQVSEYKSICQ